MKDLFTIKVNDTGQPGLIFKWSTRGDLLAVNGSRFAVQIYNRKGQVEADFAMTMDEKEKAMAMSRGGGPMCSVLEWDAAGDRLACVTKTGQALQIWSRASLDNHNLPSREVTAAGWDPHLPVLVLGTVKGSVTVYDERTQKVVGRAGIHTKRIGAIVGVGAGRFALSSDDRSVSVIQAETFQVIRTFSFTSMPSELAWDALGGPELAVAGKLPPGWLSVVLDAKRLYVVKITQSGTEETPMELQFLPVYGTILTHHWFGKGYIAIAFSSGQVIVQSMYGREVQEEVCSEKVMPNMRTCAFSGPLSRAACAFGKEVRLVEVGAEIKELRSELITLDPSQIATGLDWTPDGQVLSVSNDKGAILSFVAALPPLNASFGTAMCWLSSLNEVSLMDARNAGVEGSVATVGLTTEPAVLACGPLHFACALNNHAWVYPHNAVDGGFVVQKEFVGSVDGIALTQEFGAVQSDGRVFVHRLPGEHGGEADVEDVVLPGRGQPANIACLASSSTMFVYGTESGKVCFYSPETNTVAEEFSHTCGIRAVWPNTTGTKCIFADVNGTLHLLTPANGLSLLVADVAAAGTVTRVVWDAHDPNLFVAASRKALMAYLHVSTHVKGPSVRSVWSRPAGDAVPIALVDGIVQAQVGGGALSSLVLDTHRALRADGAVHPRDRFKALLALGRLEDAWEAAKAIDGPSEWTQLAFAALDSLDLALAIRCLRIVGDAGLVITLQGLQDREDKNLLAGHVMALVHQEYDQAQRLLLASSEKRAALELRRDLRHWDKALELAESLDPGSVAEVSAEYARMLETRCDYDAALQHYDGALASEMAKDAEDRDARLVERCVAGRVRALLQTGQIQAGEAACLDSRDRNLCREAALILEGQSQLTDAAEMFVAANMLDRAAAIYIRSKNWTALRPIMPRVQSVQVHSEYAAVQEAEGRFADALASHEAAGQWASAVRVLLDKLKNPQRAFQIARKTRDAQGALMVARYCLNLGQLKQAVEFFVIAGRLDEALDEATRHDLVEWFLSLIDDREGVEARVLFRAAQHYQERQKWTDAARCLLRCREYPGAVDLLLRDGSEAALEEAIGVVQRYPPVAEQVLSWLEQSSAAGKLAAKYMFKLQMALGKPEDAADHAVMHARMEREDNGNYRAAHASLFEMYRELRQRGKRVPADLAKSLLLVHSYILVRTLVKLEDHVGAARMLARVAANISKFPLHVVPILTSTVIECQRAGLKATAFEYAVVLMRPEYKSQVNAQYRRKIEAVVRKRAEGDELPEEMVPCPRCGVDGPETDLDCIHCKSMLPFCVASGKRVPREEWGACSSCLMPYRVSSMRRVVEANAQCPMCGVAMDAGDVRRLPEREAQESIEACMGALDAAGASDGPGEY